MFMLYWFIFASCVSINYRTLASFTIIVPAMLTEDMNVARAARPSEVVEGYKCPPISANPPTAVNPRKEASMW